MIVPCSSKSAYLSRYAETDKGWTDEDEARWPVPFWHMDAAMASLLILQTAVDEGLGACFFGIPPERTGTFKDAFGVPEEFTPVGVDHPRPPGRPTPAPPAPPRAAPASPSRRSCTAGPGEPDMGPVH